MYVCSVKYLASAHHRVSAHPTILLSLPVAAEQGGGGRGGQDDNNEDDPFQEVDKIDSFIDEDN